MYKISKHPVYQVDSFEILALVQLAMDKGINKGEFKKFIQHKKQHLRKSSK